MVNHAELAVLGARQRLVELDQERAELVKFIDGANKNVTRRVENIQRKQKRKPMTQAQKARIRRAVKASWAKRKAAEKKEK